MSRSYESSCCLFLAVCLFAQSGNLLEQADAAFRNGDTVHAASLAQQVIAREPNAVHAHLILGVIAAQNKDWTTSNRHFRTVVRLEPANPFGYFYLGQASLYQQKWDAAIQYFSQAKKRQYPEGDRLAVELALAQNEAGHPEQALASLSGVAEPPDPSLAAQYHAVSAFAQAKLNQPTRAIEAIRRALRLDASNPHNWEFLIAALLKNDEAPPALAEAIQAQQKFPDNADIEFAFALASYHVTESPLSHLALRNLREADPTSPRVLLAEGCCIESKARATRRRPRLSAQPRREWRMAPPAPAIVHKENGKYEDAEREYREAERISPQNGQVLLELGKLLLTQGRLDEAKPRLEKASVVMPDASTVQYQLGLLYRRLGQPEKAQEHFRKSKQPEQQMP